MGRCTGCGVEGRGEGLCAQCSWVQSQLAIVEDARKVATDLHFGIYHDNGCCGCTRARRRALFLVLAAGFLIGGIAMYAAGGGSGATGGGMLALAALWLVCALTCPNGPCGMYAADKTWGAVTAEEVRACCASTGMAKGDGAAAPLLAGAGAAGGGDDGGEAGVAVPSDPASQANAATIRRYFDVMNSGNEAAMTAFVAACYSADYESRTSDGKVRHKADMPGVFRGAWKGGWRIRDGALVQVTPESATYVYTLTFASGAKPARIRATATFQAPGVLRAATFDTLRLS